MVEALPANIGAVMTESQQQQVQVVDMKAFDQL